MESVASSSSASPSSAHRHFRPTQPLADRIFRALRHRLRLLHRSESHFFILGATGNVYTVTLTNTPFCTCPDRTSPCKHILFVLIRVLGVSLDDTCLRRRTLRPCRLSRLLNTPTLDDSLAGPSVRRRFHELFFQTRQLIDQSSIINGGQVEMEEGTLCPICLDEMEIKKERIVSCGTCKNLIHEHCLIEWRRSRGRRGGTCVICRARWRDRIGQEKYLNLAAYVSEDDDNNNNTSAGPGLCGG